MNVTKELLARIGNFSYEETILFSKHAIERNFQKNEILLNQGDVCKSVFYIISGEAVQFCYHDIDEHIIELHIKRDWCLNHSSFVAQQPSSTIIKAHSELTVLELSIASVHRLVALKPAFFQLGRVLQQTVSRIQYYDNASTAEEKHQQLWLKRPQLFQKFPLKMIASYLKIAPETLSRIRSKK